jgi:hypothetical protein
MGEMGPPRIALDQRLLRGAPHVVTPLFVSSYFVTLNLFQGLNCRRSKSKMLKQVQHDGEGERGRRVTGKETGSPPKKTIFLHEPIWFIITSVFSNGAYHA